MASKNQIQKILTTALGFGLGGLLWGLEAYQGAGEAGQSPFMFILGALSLGLFGGLSLVIFSKDIKKIFKVVGLGIVGCLVGFLLPAIGAYWLFMFSMISRMITRFFVLDMIVEKFINLKHIVIGDFWLHFLLTGAIIAFFYALLLKIKIRPVIWRVGVGFALGSLFAPMIGNLSPNLLLSYLITFALLGISLGLSLIWGISKAKH